MEMTRINSKREQGDGLSEESAIVGDVYKMNLAIKTYWLNR